MLPQHSHLNRWAWKYAHINITLWSKTLTLRTFMLMWVNVFIQTSIKTLRGKFPLPVCKCPSAASTCIPRGDRIQKNFWIWPQQVYSWYRIPYRIFCPLLKLLSQWRKESVPATPVFSELLITILLLLVFPIFKNRQHIDVKKLREKKFLRASALQDDAVSF